MGWIQENTRSDSRAAGPRARGFTLTELLVVISIMVLLIAITFPVISAMQNGSRIEAGLNTIGMSADVARQWVGPSRWDEDTTDAVQGEKYSGSAAIYCPTGEIRIVTNFRNARTPAGGANGNRYLEDWYSPSSPVGPNGYIDRDGVDYINIPSGVGVAGILRTGNGANDVVYLAPPFAIAFNENGQMSFGDINGRIYYDGYAAKGSKSDFRFDLSSTRPNSYNPEDWDGQSNANNEDVMDPLRPIRALPFEAIECVAGVVIYDADDFKQAGFNFAGGGSVALSSAAGQWLQTNGKTVFFSPHTGVALRDEQE